MVALCRETLGEERQQALHAKDSLGGDHHDVVDLGCTFNLTIGGTNYIKDQCYPGPAVIALGGPDADQVVLWDDTKGSPACPKPYQTKVHSKGDGSPPADGGELKAEGGDNVHTYKATCFLCMNTACGKQAYLKKPFGLGCQGLSLPDPARGHTKPVLQFKVARDGKCPD